MGGVAVESHDSLSLLPLKRTVFLVCAYVCVVYVLCVPAEVRGDQLEAGHAVQVDQEETS